MKESIQSSIYEILHIDFGAIESRIDTRRVNYARDIFCYFMRTQTGCTLEEIGKLLDGRDKGTICRSIINISDLRRIYSWVEKDINNIESKIHDNQYSR